MEKNLTQGSVLKNTMYFALPYFLSYFLQQLYGMADLYMIGMFRCDFVPHGTGGTGRICSFYRDLPHCFLVDETERYGRKWRSGCIKKCKHR